MALLLLAGSAVASNPAGPPDVYPETAEITASAAATLEVLPASGAMGAMFSITGSAFQATEVVTLTIAGPDDGTASQVMADDEGSFVLFWDSSQQSAGSYQLTASGDASSTAQASWMVRAGVLCGESDGFDAPSLDPAWSWLREDASHWSLSAQPGALRIQTQAGTLTSTANDQHNLLLRSAPSGNYRVTVQVEVHADQDYQHAGLYLYQDDDHYVRLSRAQASQAVGQGIYFSVEADTVYTTTSTADAASVVYLKLGKQDDVYRGFYSRDGILWHLVGQRQVAGISPSQVGISAANGNAPFATEIAADFEWLRVDELCSRVFLPLVLKGYTPVGELLINEVMPEPEAGGSEWVELLNVGPGPLDVGGYQVTDEDDNVYTIPDALPEVPRDGLVLIYFDGQGAGADDYDLSDNLAVLHSTAGLVDIFEDDGDQVAVYQCTPHSPDTIVAFMAYGLTPGDEAANAAQARLWGRYWFVLRRIGLGWEGEDGGPDLSGYSVGLFPGSRLNLPRRWVVYTPDTASPGMANGVPAMPWYDPPDGAVVDAATLGVSWQSLAVAEAYHFQLDETADFDSPRVDEVVSDPWWQTDEPLLAGTYYWRVSVIGHGGRQGPWLAPVEIVARELGVTARATELTAERVLDVHRLQQRKDTKLLCLDGDHRSGVDDPWDEPHPTDTGKDHGRCNCCRASVAMINHYHGGNIHQDYLSYMEYENWGDSFRWGSTGDPSIGNPALDLGHNSPSGDGSTRMAAWAWGFEEGEVEKISYKPDFDWVRQRIDQGRPMVKCAGMHCVVFAGYREDADGTRWVYVVDPAGPPPSGGHGTWLGYDTVSIATLTLPPPNVPNPARDDPAMHVDSDGDGIQDWDEINRFYTDPYDLDTDNDGIEDKVEIAAYVFEPDGTWNYREPADWDGDGLRMELDWDNDGDGFSDGCEDSNRNGIYEDGLYETSNFDDTMYTGCPQLRVQPTTLDFGWNADTRTFEVINAGGGGLAWEVSSLPTWLSLSLDSHVTGPQMRTEVEATLERRAISAGEHSDVFNIVSEFGGQQVAVHVKKDEDAPLVGAIIPTEPEPIWVDGCAGPHTLDVRADVSDYGIHGPGSGIDYVQLVFQEVGGQTRSGLPMEAVGAWYEGILGPLPPGSYEYWVLAADVAGNVTESEHYGLEVYECDPPQIGDLYVWPSQLYLAPCWDSRLIVQTMVRDETGVREVVFYYTVPTDSDPELRSVSMSPVGDDWYEAIIGPFDMAGTLQYWVTATDMGGTTAQTDQQSVDILDCEGPTIGSVGQDVDEIYLSPCVPDQINFFADPITDPSGVAGAEVWLRRADETNWSNPMPMRRQSGSDRWEATVAGFTETVIWEWKIVARNQEGGESESALSSFDVLACEGDPPHLLDIGAENRLLYLGPCEPNTTKIWATVEADLPLDHVDLLYKYSTESDWHVVPMQLDSATEQYTTTIGPLDASGTIECFSQAVDIGGMEDRSGGYSLIVYSCQPGPDIRDIQLDPQNIYPEPCTPNALDVQATVEPEPDRTVTEVKLRYTRGDWTDFQELSMNPVGGDVYSCTISGLVELDIYRFYIEASNDLGEQSQSDTKSFGVSPCEIPGPLIFQVDVEETSLFESPCEPNRTEVRAAVSDPLGVDQVEIRYWPQAGTAAFDPAPMELITPGGPYGGEFGDLTPGAWMYSIRAVNTYGVATSSPPATLMVHRCQVQGPDITVRAPDEAISASPCRPSRTVIEAQLSDEYEIEAVSLLYRLDEGDWQARVMSEDSPGEYAAVLGDFDQGGMVTYLVTARNALGGWAASESATLQVNDCHLPTVGTPTESADPIYVPPCDLTGITIEAEITDPDGIAGAWLAYGETGPERIPWQVVALQQIPDTDRWKVDVGPFDSPTVYAYAIYALNNVGGGAWSTAGTFWVLSCSRPTIGDVTTSETPIYVAPCQPYRLTVSAKISSEQGVSGAWIGYRQADVPQAQWRFAAMSPSEQPDWYEGQIGPFGQAMTLEYRVGARSVARGWAWTEPDQVEVMDCQRPTIEKVSSSETSIYTPPCLPNTTVITAQR
jgi:regulation of enolase protein 1 (concanavalin A-like superfamily)